MDLTPSVGTAPILTTGIVMMIIATNITIILPNFPRTRTNFPWMHVDVLVQLGEKILLYIRAYFCVLKS